MNSKELRHKAAGIATEMKGIVDKAKSEKRGTSGDEDTNWNNLKTGYEEVVVQLAKAEKDEARDSYMSEIVERYVEVGDDSPPGRQNPEQRNEIVTGRSMVAGQAIRSRYFPATGLSATEHPELAEAYDAMLRFGPGVLTAEHRQLIANRYEQRGTSPQAVGTDNLGGYTVPEGFSGKLEEAMLAFGGVRSAALVIKTATGNNIPWPTVNDTATVGTLLTENSASTVADVTFGEVVLNAYKYTSGIVKVSKELLQDSAFDLSSLLARLMGERLGRGTAAAYCTGTGSSQPQGITKATGATTLGHKLLASLTYDEIVDLKHSVDPAYRAGAKFVFNDAVFRKLKALKDGESRPLWQPNVASAVPATIDGDTFIIDQGMPAFAANARPVVYGDLSKFIVRDSLGFDLVVLRERYAENHQVAFIAIMRTDSKLLDAGTAPIKAMVCSA